MRKPSRIDLLWVGEVVLTSLSTRLYDYAFDFVSARLKYPNEQVYGIIGLAVIIGAALVAFFLILYYSKWLRIRRQETSINVYSKTELNVREFLKKAKHEIDIFGITLETISGDYIDTIKNLLKSKNIKKVRILIYNPKSTLINSINTLVKSNTGTIQSSVQRFVDLKSEIGDDARKFEIKLFDNIPIQSMFIIDPNTNSDGVMRVEPYLFGIRKEERRIQELSSKKEKELFQTYYRSFEEMWGKGKPVSDSDLT
jgi:hypothetical protein